MRCALEHRALENAALCSLQLVLPNKRCQNPAFNFEMENSDARCPGCCLSVAVRDLHALGCPCLIPRANGSSDQRLIKRYACSEENMPQPVQAVSRPMQERYVVQGCVLRRLHLVWYLRPHVLTLGFSRAAIQHSCAVFELAPRAPEPQCAFRGVGAAFDVREATR
jgi:hypothetical protein